ncbi:MAG TPA: AEC family transporter [Bacteroidales bacterium]|nr:AEC family transporter [Bacteroidales bacterium]HOK75082.1 AEC family transporter [Bacteroidales bacterium]HOM41212.1 AEC family transporter [Bacteroidales bacterium]HOU29648.1 AEC family transporter [Bacteroidales bacterium]HPP92959.1 AEC family transporter [Bacteroidales bacterium]
MPVEIIVNQILILAIVALVGVIASKAGVITSEGKDFLAKIIFNVTLPSMLLASFGSIDATPRLLTNSLEFIGLSFFSIMLLFIAGTAASSILKLKGEESAIFRIHSMMGNIIYLAFPVIYSLYGQEGILYGSIFTIVSNVVLWTLGIVIIAGNSKISVKESFKYIINPNTIAILTGFCLFLLHIKLPKIIIDSVGGIGSTNTYLSILYIGSVLFYSKTGRYLKNINIYVLSFNKMILVPFLLTGIFWLAAAYLNLHFDKLVLSVLILESAMPCMVNVVIIAKILGMDDAPAVANVFVSTILSIITLPIVLIFLSVLK